MTGYIRLEEAPQFSISYPTCSVCVVDLENDSDGWTCPVCGTSWRNNADDGEPGTLYTEWSGEEPEGPTLNAEEAFVAGMKHEAEEKQRQYKRWGWCEHGRPGECVHRDCPGGTARRAEANPD